MAENTEYEMKVTWRDIRPENIWVERRAGTSVNCTFESIEDAGDELHDLAGDAWSWEGGVLMGGDVFGENPWIEYTADTWRKGGEPLSQAEKTALSKYICA